MNGAVGASPGTLAEYERVGAAMDDDLVVAARRLQEALAAISPMLSRCAALNHGRDAESLARDALAHDRRAGRVGRRFCAADASYAFDRWTTGEVADYARSLAAVGWLSKAGPDRAELFGLLDRLAADGLDDLARRVAELPDEKRGFWNGAREGVVEGSFATQPYADRAGAWGKTLGQLVAGLLVYGDVRDSIAEYSRGNVVGGTWDLVGAVPLGGDAAKLLDAGDAAAAVARGGRRIVRRAEDFASAAGLADDVATASTFDTARRSVHRPDSASAGAATAVVLNHRAAEIDRWLAGAHERLILAVAVDPQLAAMVGAGSVIVVTLARDPSTERGYRVADGPRFVRS